MNDHTNQSEDKEDEKNDNVKLFFSEEKDDFKFFVTIEALDEWLDDERQIWDWVQDPHHVNVSIRGIFIGQFIDAKNLIAPILQKKRQNVEYYIELDSAVHNVSMIYSRRNLITSSSPEAKLIFSLKDENPAKAVYALAYFTGINSLLYTHSDAVLALVEASHYENGITASSIAAQSESITDLIQEQSSHVEHNKQKLQQFEESHHKALKTITQTINEQKDNYTKFLEKSEAEFNRVNQTYSEHMALKSPVEYWTTNSKWAYTQAGVIFLCIAISIFFSWDFFSEKSAFIMNLEKEQFHYGKASFLLFVSLVGFWLLRFVFQILLSRLHLATEAAEKAVMTKAYLSLLEEGKVDEQEREIVFRTIFRPSGSGLIKEESTHPVLEIFSKVLKKE